MHRIPDPNPQHCYRLCHMSFLTKHSLPYIPVPEFWIRKCVGSDGREKGMLQIDDRLIGRIKIFWWIKNLKDRSGATNQWGTGVLESDQILVMNIALKQNIVPDPWHLRSVPVHWITPDPDPYHALRWLLRCQLKSFFAYLLRYLL